MKIFFVFFVVLAIDTIINLDINRGNAAYSEKVSAIEIK